MSEPVVVEEKKAPVVELDIAKEKGGAMVSGSPIEGLLAWEGDTVEQIMRDMIDPRHVGMKTEYKNPLVISQGRLMAKWCELENCPKTARLWTAFIGFFEIDMVSYDRKSRTEIKEMVTARRQEQSAKEKLVASDGAQR